MTKQELDEILSQNGGEIVFEDGYSLSIYCPGYYCTYTPDQGVGQGIVCRFEKAVKFYSYHCAAKSTNFDRLKVTSDDIKLVENFITKTTEGMTHQEMQAIVKMVYHTFVHSH